LKKRCQNKITVNGYGFLIKFKEPVGSLKDLAKIWCFLTSSLKVFGEPWFWVKTGSFEDHWLVRVLEYLNLSCWFFSWKRAKELPPTLILSS